MQELVKIIKNEPFTDSMVIAEGTGNEHSSVTRILRNYVEDFKEFGNMRFLDLKSKNPQGGRPVKIYLLNEQQATLLMTYLGNSEIVRKFKKELVRQFYQMRQSILEHQSPHWQATRLESKVNRKMETDVIQNFVAYAKSQGSQNAEKYYMIFSKLANRMAGIEAGSREKVTARQLNMLSLMEHIIGEVIQIGMERELPYKEIYQVCKVRMEQFQEIAYLTVLT